MKTYLKSFVILILMSLPLLAQGIENELSRPNRKGCVAPVENVSGKPSGREPVVKFTEKVENEIFQKNVALKGIHLVGSEELQDPMGLGDLDKYTKMLLRMTANNLAYKVSARDLDLHGIFYLAEPLGDGTSLEFTYSADKRIREPFYKLTAINLIKRNGEKILLNSSPMIDEGTRLRKSLELWTVEQEQSDDGPIAIDTQAIPESVSKELRSLGNQDSTNVIDQVSKGFSDPKNRQYFQQAAENFDELVIPTVISGKILKKYLKWLTRLGKLQTDVLEKMKTPSLGRLIFKYRVSDILELIGLGSRTFLLKSVAYGLAAVAAGSTIRTELPKLVEHVPALSSLMQEKQILTMSAYEQAVSQYSLKEQSADGGHMGHITVYITEGKEHGDKTKRDETIEYFEKSEVMIVNPLNGKGSFKVIDKKQSPEDFERYLKIVAAGK